MSMRFRIQADAEFEAEDINDAFRWLAEHFKALADDKEQERDAGFRGKIDIRPVVPCVSTYDFMKCQLHEGHEGRHMHRRARATTHTWDNHDFPMARSE
jgi:hypothetical protein